MTPDKYIVILGGIGLIGFIWWFFFGDKGDLEFVKEKTKIIVSGGYKPSIIKIKKDSTVTLSFIRTENNSCLEEIVIPDFKISKYLPLKKIIDIKINPKKKGEFKFHCGMNMYHGKIIVV